MPSIVAITSELPWPLDSGGHLRTYHLLRALAATCDVRLVTPVARACDAGQRSALDRAGLAARLVAVAPRRLATEAARALGAALQREPYVMFARHRRRSVRHMLEREMARRRPDVVYLDHLDSLVYAAAAGNVPIVLDMHNVYSRVASRAAIEANGLLRRRYLSGQAQLLERMERKAMRVAHTVLAVSDEEAAHFKRLGATRVVVVPNGVDCATFESVADLDRTSAPAILFVGTLSWPPNASAARFLATEVLPAVRRRLPLARVVIAGKDPAPDLLALHDPGAHVTVAANVPDIRTCYRDAHLVAVPLQAGAGTRLKILEAFAAGVPVVSTPIGCEGLGAIDGHHLSVADREQFADAVVRLLTNPDRSRSIATEARAFARARYDWSAIGKRAADAVLAASEASVNAPARAPVRARPPTPIRILELRSVRGTGGGPEKTILLGAARSDTRRFAVTVTYLRDARDTVFAIDERAKQLGLDYREVVERHSFDWSVLPALRQIVRDREIDIVHGHDYKTNLLALYLSRTEAVIPMSTAHGWASNSWRERLVYYPVEKRLLSLFPVVVAVSGPIRRALERSGVPSERLRTLLNGIDHRAFRRSRQAEAAARLSLGVEADHFAVGAVGRLDARKRFDLLLDAFSRVYNDNPRARLVIAGDGPVRTALEARAAELFPAGVCRLLGHWTDIARLHHALDLFVQSSDFEGTPNAVLEAMAFETPIVATRAGGTAALVRDGIDAWLVARGDLNALAGAMTQAMCDPAAAFDRAQSARRRVEGELSFDTRQQALEQIYHDLVVGRSTPTSRAILRWA